MSRVSFGYGYASPDLEAQQATGDADAVSPFGHAVAQFLLRSQPRSAHDHRIREVGLRLKQQIGSGPQFFQGVPFCCIADSRDDHRVRLRPDGQAVPAVLVAYRTRLLIRDADVGEGNGLTGICIAKGTLDELLGNGCLAGKQKGQGKKDAEHMECVCAKEHPLPGRACLFLDQRSLLVYAPKNSSSKPGRMRR